MSCQSSIQCWDSKPQPLKHELTPVTTASVKVIKQSTTTAVAGFDPSTEEKDNQDLHTQQQQQQQRRRRRQQRRRRSFATKTHLRFRTDLNLS